MSMCFLQITVEITIIDVNEFNPVFSMDTYVGRVDEHNGITGDNAGNGTVVETVIATDDDGPNTAAGQIEYYITGGNQLGIFDIPDPNVSVSLFNVYIVPSPVGVELGSMGMISIFISSWQN